jgi:outer membrane lipoprotein-sorting protein
MEWTKVLRIAACWVASACAAVGQEPSPQGGATGQQAPAVRPDVEAVLQRIQQAAKDLRSYQCAIDYVLRQPLLESKTRRTGMVYYVRKPNGSRLRVNFATLEQDDGKVQPYMQQFLFDGVWLIDVDYQVKSWEKRQMADANKPTDAFDLAGRELPIAGFTGIDELRRDFDMEIVPPPSGQTGESGGVTLSMKARPGSRYGKDYRSMAFSIDKAIGLPVKVEAESTEGDFYDISFAQVKVNSPIEDSIFDLKVPKDFGEPEIIPLEASKGKGIHPTHDR